jgi:hypothetical protein
MTIERVRRHASAAGLLLGLAAVMLPETAWSAPDDVERVETVYQAIATGSESTSGLTETSKAVTDEFVSAVLEICEELADRQGYAGGALAAEVASDPFRASVRKTIGRKLDPVWQMRDPEERRSALMRELKNLVSPHVAGWLLASWLDQPAPGAFLPPAPKVGASSLERQVTSSTVGALEFSAESSRLLRDWGGAGFGNGVLDAGEWAQLSLILANPGELPYFSSSAWLRSADDCLWVEPPQERVLRELPAGGGTAVLDTWIYVSRHCGDRAALAIEISDTHHGKQQIEVVLRPRPAIDGSLQDVKIDIDVPGFSDGGDDVVLRPDWKGEVSADVSLKGGGAVGAIMQIGTNKKTERLFKTLKMRSSPMVRESNTLFRAGDDLDIECAESYRYYAELTSIGREGRWLGSGGGTLWLAVDVELYVPWSAGGSVRPKVAEGAVMTPEMLRKIEGIVGDYIELQTRPGSPQLDGSVAAADAIEAVFDGEGFRARAAEITGLALEDSSGLVETIRYRFRGYIPLQVEGREQAIADATEYDIEPEPDFEPEPEPEAVAEELPKRTAFRFVPLGIMSVPAEFRGRLTGYQLNLGVVTIDRPVGFFFTVGFAPLPSEGIVQIPIRVGAQFNLNGIKPFAKAVPWLNFSFRIGGAIDVVPGLDVTGGLELGPALDFFPTRRFSIGSGIRFGPSRGFVTGEFYDSFSWDIIRIGFH